MPGVAQRYAAASKKLSGEWAQAKRTVGIAAGVAFVLAVAAFATMNSGLVPALWVATLADVAKGEGPKPKTVRRDDVLTKTYGRSISWMFDAFYEAHDVYGAAWTIGLRSPVYITPSQFGPTELVNVQSNVKMGGGGAENLNWFVILDGPLRGTIYLKGVAAAGGNTQHVLYSAYRACPESKWLGLEDKPKPVPRSLLRAPDVVCEKAARLLGVVH